MNTTEKIDPVMVMHLIAAAATEGAEYSNWSDEFARSYFSETIQRIHQKILDSGIDFNRMTADELEAWGFGKWNDGGLRLVPLWLKGALKPGTTLVTVSGQQAIVGTDVVDNDARQGYLAYGVFPRKDTPEEMKARFAKSLERLATPPAQYRRGDIITDGATTGSIVSMGTFFTIDAFSKARGIRVVKPIDRHPDDFAYLVDRGEEFGANQYMAFTYQEVYTEFREVNDGAS